MNKFKVDIKKLQAEYPIISTNKLLVINNALIKAYKTIDINSGIIELADADNWRTQFNEILKRKKETPSWPLALKNWVADIQESISCERAYTIFDYDNPNVLIKMAYDDSLSGENPTISKYSEFLVQGSIDDNKVVHFIMQMEKVQWIVQGVGYSYIFDDLQKELESYSHTSSKGLKLNKQLDTIPKTRTLKWQKPSVLLAYLINELKRTGFIEDIDVWKTCETIFLDKKGLPIKNDKFTSMVQNFENNKTLNGTKGLPKNHDELTNIIQELKKIQKNFEN